ncbi:MAG: type I methionyl aminopeptidase [Planctomycetia bacterium]|nr:type I methionyl aminopeptidase [Planctomycetia bacterium]NCF99047.1 type I methionyl aminopeptidase [Planctomycetia bacterium]NCG56621.1 type I methionyl aminopeptidase [Pseudomonadota bacterium]
MIHYKSSREIDLMASAGEMVARTFQRIAPMIQPGTRTQDIDDAVRDSIVDLGGKALFLGYHGFPAHSCISVNEEVVHGIPGERILLDGDLVSIDIGIEAQGFCGDSARSFLVGSPSSETQNVLDVCRAALAKGIEGAYPGNTLCGLISGIEAVIQASELGLVKEFVGHGIGRTMHEEPQVPNFVSVDLKKRDFELREGLVLAIEPMVNGGTGGVKTLKDGWTVVTRDRRVSAHCEHTVAITGDGPRVLTLGPGESWPPLKDAVGQ